MSRIHQHDGDSLCLAKRPRRKTDHDNTPPLCGQVTAFLLLHSGPTVSDFPNLSYPFHLIGSQITIVRYM